MKFSFPKKWYCVLSTPFVNTNTTTTTTTTTTNNNNNNNNSLTINLSTKEKTKGALFSNSTYLIAVGDVVSFIFELSSSTNNKKINS